MTVAATITPMPLRILILEDTPADAELLLHELKKTGYAVSASMISTRAEYEQRLRDGDFDIIFADFNMRSWNGLEALEMLQATGKAIPFIIVTGTVGDIEAVECIKRGATDYVLKHAMARLVVAVPRALKEFAAKREQVKDIIEKRRIQEQLLEAQKLEAIGQLAGGVSHDFNNLLGVIMGQAELLADRLEDESLRNRAKSIVQAAVRGASLANQLLAFSRKQLVEPTILSLNSLVEETVKLLGRTLGEEVELETRLAKDVWCVSADAGQMQQVLLNLAINSRDAMPHGGKLVIETANIEKIDFHMQRELTQSPGDYVLLSVTDNGEGMSDHVREKIFEPFFTTKAPGKGTGLGLAMVYGIIKQRDGHISVSSELTKGTVFRIYLPRALSGQIKVLKPSIPAWGSETILVVEDQDSVRQIVVEMLQDYGYTVLQACNGKLALEIIAQQNGAIHLVITDVIMPQMSGTELARQLKSVLPSAKLLFMSGYTGDSVHRQGGLAEGVAFVQKPFSPTALVGKVRQVLDGIH
jgi:two-component system cell cycle sensor histidine kinase/response regulator CckA